MTTYRLRVRDTFAAAHRLPDHAGDCANLHGHTWRVELEVAARELGSAGMVLDFADLKRALRAAIADLDHSCLNDLKTFELVPPTAEHVATVLYSRLAGTVPALAAVTVWESPEASVRLEARGGAEEEQSRRISSHGLARPRAPK